MCAKNDPAFKKLKKRMQGHPDRRFASLSSRPSFYIFVIPTGVLLFCHPDRHFTYLSFRPSFYIFVIPTGVLLLCHPDRSAAEWRDLANNLKPISIPVGWGLPHRCHYFLARSSALSRAPKPGFHSSRRVMFFLLATFINCS